VVPGPTHTHTDVPGPCPKPHRALALGTPTPHQSMHAWLDREHGQRWGRAGARTKGVHWHLASPPFKLGLLSFLALAPRTAPSLPPTHPPAHPPAHIPPTHLNPSTILSSVSSAVRSVQRASCAQMLAKWTLSSKAKTGSAPPSPSWTCKHTRV
jgi:hypothetical protein